MEIWSGCHGAKFATQLSSSCVVSLLHLCTHNTTLELTTILYKVQFVTKILPTQAATMCMRHTTTACYTQVGFVCTHSCWSHTVTILLYTSVLLGMICAIYLIPNVLLAVVVLCESVWIVFLKPSVLKSWMPCYSELIKGCVWKWS